MIYSNIKKAKFIDRPNRFIANIEIDGKRKVCHVKNTGRCKELLVNGADIFVQEFKNTSRKTAYDLICVNKNGQMVNIDSQAPNKVFAEWVKNSNYFGNVTLLKPETKYKNSRFDFYLETEDRKIYIETKGVTLEENQTASFPDAPTQRGVKHLEELSDCVAEGFEAYVFFIVQMENINLFMPNYKTHKEFCEALKTAVDKGVKAKCLGCNVKSDSLYIDKFIKINLEI